MKALMLVFVSFISISIATSTFAKEQIIAADLWFPGDVGSEWLYSVEHDVFHSTEKIVDPKMLDNKEYVIVKGNYSPCFFLLTISSHVVKIGT